MGPELSRNQVLIPEFPLAELTPLNSVPAWRAVGGCVGLEMKAALQVAGLFEAPLDGVLTGPARRQGGGEAVLGLVREVQSFKPKVLRFRLGMSFPHGVGLCASCLKAWRLFSKENLLLCHLCHTHQADSPKLPT